MPASNRMVVFPNHIRKFISIISILDAAMLFMNLKGSFRMWRLMSIWFMGPASAKRAKNNIENADAMIRFGM